MPEPTTLAALECVACANLGDWSHGRLIRPYTPPIDLGHGYEAHRIYHVLCWNRVRTAEGLASYSDAELLKMRGLGVKMLARIRELVPAPGPREAGVTRYRPRGNTIEAVRWTGEGNCVDVFALLGWDHPDDELDHSEIRGLGNDGTQVAYPGDWIIRARTEGWFTVLTDDDFNQRYEEA